MIKFTIACLVLSSSVSFALFTPQPKSDLFMKIEGKYEPGKNNLDHIRVGRLNFNIKNENIVRYNKTDLKGLLERKIFKIKHSDIHSITLGSL